MKKIMIIGAGGHASSCLEIIKSEKKLKVVGFFDRSKDQFHNLDFLIRGLKIVVSNCCGKSSSQIYEASSGIRSVSANYGCKALC